MESLLCGCKAIRSCIASVIHYRKRLVPSIPWQSNEVVLYNVRLLFHYVSGLVELGLSESFRVDVDIGNESLVAWRMGSHFCGSHGHVIDYIFESAFLMLSVPHSDGVVSKETHGGMMLSLVIASIGSVCFLRVAPHGSGSLFRILSLFYCCLIIAFIGCLVKILSSRVSKGSGSERSSGRPLSGIGR
jgi:hypothetical protein